MKKLITLFLLHLLLISACSKKSDSNPTTSNNLVTVSTLAGSGVQGDLNGIGTAASFGDISGIAVDVSGNVYLADKKNNNIRKITPSGVVSTLAGSGVLGDTDGASTVASFVSPQGIAVDVSGYLYVTAGNLIRKITPSGIVSTLAGNVYVASGNQNGIGTAASFYSPFGIAVDAAGNLFVADEGNNLIRKITPTGVVSTFAGSGVQGDNDGTGTAASFNAPCGITVDASDNVYVSEPYSYLIRKISPSGVVSTLAGNGTQGNTNGTSMAASFTYPFGLTVDPAGNVYVAAMNLIRKITPSGIVSTLAGNIISGKTNGVGSQASFDTVNAVAIDATGNVYVADTGNALVRKIVIK